MWDSLLSIRIASPTLIVTVNGFFGNTYEKFFSVNAKEEDVKVVGVVVQGYRDVR
jgi:hypothetical protein